MSITSGPSSAAKATGSRRSAASGTVSTMPDGAASPGTADPADERALGADARLIRNVRWRLVLWSGLTTLVVLAALGIALYVSAARTLEANGIKQLDNRAAVYLVDHDPRSGPGQGFAFGGGSSGTFAYIVNDSGQTVGRGPFALP